MLNNNKLKATRIVIARILFVSHIEMINISVNVIEIGYPIINPNNKKVNTLVICDGSGVADLAS